MSKSKVVKSVELTEVEKYAVDGMVADGLGAGEIAKRLGSSVAVVRSHIESTQDSKGNEIVVDKAILDAVRKKLISGAHATLAQSQQMINKAMRTLGRAPKNVNELYAAVISSLPASVLMQNTTAGGNRGVNFMTEAASQKGENTGRYNPVKVEHPHIFKINEDRD